MSKKQFEVVKQARPSIIFLQSDGGRNEEEWNTIYSNRKLYDEGIDWDCKVYKIYEDHNNGLYAMGKKVTDFIWQTVDRCIFLEDDHIPTVSYFRFCAELLEKYKDDMRIECICGMNSLEVWEKSSSDYFFSKQGSIWGTARWRNRFFARTDFSYFSDPYIMSLLKKETKSNKTAWKRLCGYGSQSIYEGHVPSVEFYTEFSMYSQHRVQIIPKYNMISNIGCTNNSEHADSIKMLPRGIRRLFNMKTYEIDFPLTHPQWVIPDDEYEKQRNRILAYNHPVIRYFRKIERALYKISKGEFAFVIKKIKINQKQKNSKTET